MNLKNRNRPTDIENKFMATKGEVRGQEINQEFGINIYTILYTKYVHKNLLYSRGPILYLIQKPIMEKNLKKMYMYIYIYLNHFATHLKLTQHCKLNIFPF